VKYELLATLCCPECRESLELSGAHELHGEIERGDLVCKSCGKQYPIVEYVPRFVPSENYTSTFGFQWNEFRQTQLDSHTGLPLSRERFLFSTAWTPFDVADKSVLDAGCGAGRFAEVAISFGAHVTAIDYSSAVDACWKNLGPHPRLNVVQADMYHLPFKDDSFDYIYSFGVLQHTPNVKEAFLSLPRLLRPQGKLAVDVYPRLLLNILWPKYWLRPMTKRMSSRDLFRLVQIMVKVLLPISLVTGRIPLIGRKLRYCIPVANHEPDFPLSRVQVKEWAILNTYDMLAPAHDHPQSARSLRDWFDLAGFRRVEVFRKGHLIGRGVKAVP
jgi:SAM-dependent methyltransferase